MKFQLKALTAALVLAASASAQAAVDLPNTGNGSLMLTLIDRTANVSAIFDLGYNYLDFNASAAVGAIGSQLNGPGITWNLASNPDYAAVLSAFTGAGASLANSSYAVTAADNVGTTTLGGQGYLGSYVSQGPAILTSPVVTAAGQFNNYVNNAANAPSLYLFSNLNTAVNGGEVANVALGGPAYAGTLIYNLNRLNGTGNTVMATVGTTMGFQQVITGANGIAASNQTTLNSLVTNTFNLSSAGTLTYVGVAAVPEADTWAMMMLGLGFMGFVARRKQQA